MSTSSIYSILNQCFYETAFSCMQIYETTDICMEQCFTLLIKSDNKNQENKIKRSHSDSCVKYSRENKENDSEGWELLQIRMQ